MNIKTLAHVALSTSMLVALGAGVSNASAMTAAECHAKFQNSHSRLSFAKYREAHCAGVRARTTKADVSKARTKVEHKEAGARSEASRTRSKVEERAHGEESKARGHVEEAKSKRGGFFHRHTAAAEDKADRDVSSARDSVEKTEKRSKRSFFSRRSHGVVFPSRVSSEYSSLPEGIAREKTCAAQYEANKANGGNGNLVWTQQGGGYWSECNAHLKGE